MKKFYSAVLLCGVLTLAALFLLSPATSAAGENILAELLRLPAPPPPNPLAEPSKRRTPYTGNLAMGRASKSKVPADDVPLEELLAYWQQQSQTYQPLRYNPKASDKTLERILKACEEDPEKFADFLNIFPTNEAIAATLKNYYDREIGEPALGGYWQERVKRWLTYNSKFFTAELTKEAKKVKDANEYVTNQNELLALTRVDWDAAQPIVERLANDSAQPVAGVLTKWAYYRHALDNDNPGDIELYREQLKKVVEDKNATDGMRDLALDALVSEKTWEGRDEWYYSLLKDETLHDLRVGGNSYTGLTTLILYSEPGKYTKKMTELLKDGDAAVKAAAIRNIGSSTLDDDPETIKPMLPWLQNKHWATDTGNTRATIVRTLISVKLPESVPGLIAIMNEKLERGQLTPAEKARQAAMSAANAAMYAANSANVAINAASFPREVEGDRYPFRYAAIEALGNQGDARAVPALRLVLPQVDDYERRVVIKAMWRCGAFSVSEQLAGIEIAAKPMVPQFEAMRQAVSAARAMPAEEELEEDPVEDTGTEETVVESPRLMGAAVNARAGYAVAAPKAFDLSQVPPMLGTLLSGEKKVSDELVFAMADKIDRTEKSDPGLSAVLLAILRNWEGTAVNTVALRNLRKDRLDVDHLVKLLAVRKALMADLSGEVSNAYASTPIAKGISACIIENGDIYEEILNGTSNEGKTALLGCARLIRAKLSVEKVAALLTNPDKLLAQAADAYLESEDSPEARRAVLAADPGKARILGARNVFGRIEGGMYWGSDIYQLFATVDTSFVTPVSNAKFVMNQLSLQKEMKADPKLLGVYSYDDNFIRVYQDRAMFSWQDDPSRYYERQLTPAEFSNFRNYIAEEGVDGYAPFIADCDGCIEKEFLMFGRAGGRRVYIRAEKLPKFAANIEKLLAEMRQPPAQLHYWLEKYIPGLEVLFAEKTLKAKDVWKNGADVRLLVEDTPHREQLENEFTAQVEKERKAAEENEDEDDDESYDYDYEERNDKRAAKLMESWSWMKFADGRLQGLAGAPSPNDLLPKLDGLKAAAGDEQWKARTAAFELRTGGEQLVKVAGGRETVIGKGDYGRPVLTANAAWAVATKYIEYEMKLVRINMSTGKESFIMLPNDLSMRPVVFVPSLNRMLLAPGGYDYEYEHGDRMSNWSSLYLLDVDTGVVQPVKGDAGALAQQTHRPLQNAAAPDTFWAAVPGKRKDQTLIGVYNAKTLLFKQMIALPRISFDSMNMWVDQAENKAYVVYEGQVLRVPLAKPTP